jgi:hypothetical protein
MFENFVLYFCRKKEAEDVKEIKREIVCLLSFRFLVVLKSFFCGLVRFCNDRFS